MWARAARFGCVPLVLLLVSCGRDAEPTGSETEALTQGVERWAVVLDDAAGDPGTFAAGHGIVPARVYSHAFRGFAAPLSQHALDALRADPRVRFVEADYPMHVEAQTVSEGISRIDAPLNMVSKIDGIDEPVDVDIAIIDTGIQRDHPDLNVVGGVNFVVKNPTAPPDDKYDDLEGHGTHVAGIAAARDNDFGSVGVAPGARLWAVRVLDRRGSGSMTDIAAGVDWVAARADVIEVANLSLGGTGSDQPHTVCSDITGDTLHLAICNAVEAGVTFAVAAGNETDDAAKHVPAAYDEVITVSALADFDGRPGRLVTSAVACNGVTSPDDSLACFSNYGADVDIMAPGLYIYSTYLRGGYAEESGTSMAAPFVTGAAAVYKAKHPAATPAEVRQALIDAGDQTPCPEKPCLNDPDHVQEPLLYLGTVDEPFEDYAPGTLPERFAWTSEGSGFVSIEAGSGPEGSQTLRVGLDDNTPTAGYDYALGKVCFANPTDTYLHARFALRLDSLVTWDAIGISGGGEWLYWWWIDPTGRVYDDVDVGTLAAAEWHDVDLTIDRAAGETGTASLALDGAPYSTDLSIWGTDPAAPMQCLLLLANVSDVPYFFDLDDVHLRGRP